MTEVAVGEDEFRFRQCLALLEVGEVEPGMVWLDLGCHRGIS